MARPPIGIRCAVVVAMGLITFVAPPPPIAGRTPYAYFRTR